MRLVVERLLASFIISWRYIMYTLRAERDGCRTKKFGSFKTREDIEKHIDKMDDRASKTKPDGLWLDDWDLIIEDETGKCWIFLEIGDWEELEE